MFFRVFFLFSSRVFLIVATLAIVWFLQYESYFFIFRVFWFFRWKSRKIDAKTRSQKIIKKWRSGHPFWDPESMKIDAGSPEKRLNCAKKCRFWKIPFFDRFFDAFFHEFCVPWASRGGSQNRLFRFFFRLLARPSLQSCSWGLLGPFRIHFSLIFGWFWHNCCSISSRLFVDLLSICCPSWADFG